MIVDLAGPEYHFVGTSDVIGLESKEKMESRGLASPDFSDALAATFAVRVARLDNPVRRGGHSQPRVASGVGYDPLADTSAPRRPRSPDMRPRVFP